VGYERNLEGRWQAQAWHADVYSGETEEERWWLAVMPSIAPIVYDLEGPAVLTRVSGVNGADLLQLSINELSHDIRLTPFAARKVGAARDEFLRGL
jgi:hypothetical protein